MAVRSSATLLNFIQFCLQHSTTLDKLAKLGNSRTPELLAKTRNYGQIKNRKKLEL